MLYSPIILLIFILNASCVDKMVQISGRVSNGYPSASSEDDCVAVCFWTNDCFLAHVFMINGMLMCELYSYAHYFELLTVEKTNDGSFVAFKVTLPSETCPSSYDVIKFTFVTNTGDSYSWNTTESGWIFNGCRDGWQRFERANDVSVCMQVFPNNGISRDYAIQYCGNKNANLSGVASIEETNWIHGHLPSLGANSEFQGVWIDGIRVCPTENPKCDNIVWSDPTTGKGALVPSNFWASYVGGTQLPENCLTVALLPYNEPQMINDNRCVGDDTIIRGVACGYSLG